MTSVSFRDESFYCNYSSLLREPLNRLNQRVFNLFEDLPEQSRVKELACRVLFIVSLPFSYLVASVLSMGADLIDACFGNFTHCSHNESALNLNETKTINNKPLLIDPAEEVAFSRFSRRPQSSPHFLELERIIQERVINTSQQTTEHPFKSDEDCELEKIFSASSKNHNPEFPNPHFHQIPQRILCRASSWEELQQYINDEDGLMTLEADSEVASITFEAAGHGFVPLLSLPSRIAKPIAVKIESLKTGVLEFIDPVLDDIFVDESKFLATKFHALAALQFLAKYFTKSCRAWTKREDNPEGVLAFFGEIQRNAIKTSLDISTEAFSTSIKDFDKDSHIPDLFKDFNFADIKNSESIDISNDIFWYSRIICHLFTLLKDGGRPFALANFDNLLTIGFLGVDSERVFIFDSTAPSFEVSDVDGACMFIQKKINKYSLSPKVDLYYGALKIDT